MRPSPPAIRLGRTHQRRSGVLDALIHVVCIASLVGDHSLRLETSDQLVAASGVVALAWLEQRARRSAQRVSGGMDVGAHAVAGVAQSPGIRPFCNARTGRVLVGVHGGTVDRQPLGGGLCRRQHRQEAAQGATRNPAEDATLDHLIVAEALWQIAPVRPGAGQPQQERGRTGICRSMARAGPRARLERDRAAAPTGRRAVCPLRRTL